MFSNYELVKFYYKDIRLEREEKALVVAFEPTKELKELGREIYNALRQIIKSRKDVEKFNENDDFWFHSIFAYQIPEKEEKL